ncbi:lysophospholipid acyltransferase family protein [Actinocorallia sp. A-T 12471]|uniref:lysophospholipid acyltransferase family protein n=1 Tax=Actinocorallia sp. A-T 12471 TaxID=3089813 RepID=UPI0029D0FDBB|nr:lysophospholipid acyltransferase family protein [Actinocorallia sp. A-T 12471]MDX6742024.1 lysophospholipid acyltransferase family protein [Actinocorallia sp. A-T 12471]
MRLVVPPAFRVLFHLRVEGRENIPASGPLIVAANHQSFIDSYVIPVALLPLKTVFLAKAEYFEGKGVKGRLSRWFFTSMGMVPVARGDGSSAMGSLEQAAEIVQGGDVFALYPEGTRSMDGRLYRGRTGAGWLALTTGAPVLPVGLIGTDELQPYGSRLPKIGRRVTVRIGEPLTFGGYGAMPKGRARRAITDEIVQAIQKLTGQEYVPEYNDHQSKGEV